MRFPATVRVTREVDPNGLPVATAEIDVTEADGAMPTPGGDQGDQGDRGDPQPAFRWMGDATSAELAQMNLQDSDRLKAWRDPATNNMHVWTGSFWRVSADVYGPTGADGPGTGLMVRNADAGSDTASAELSGVAPDQTLTLRVPRGLRGNKGAPGAALPIRSMPDYDDTLAPKDSQVVAYSTTTQKFLPATFPRMHGPYVTQATSAIAQFSGERQVGQLIVPALPFEWRPVVFGNIECGKVADGWTDPDVVVVDVLMSQSDRNPVLVARGTSIGSRGVGCAAIGPLMWESITPSDRNRVAAAGRDTVFLMNVAYWGQGSASSSVRRSNLTVWAQPV